MGVGKDVARFDFSRAVVGSEDYDVETDAFLGAHFVEIVAVDELRAIEIIWLVDNGYAIATDGYLTAADGWNLVGYLRGTKSAHSRLTADGRSSRDVLAGMIDELNRSGRIRIGLLPPELMKGFVA